MDTILQGIPATMCYIDDILVTGSTEREHLQTLEEVLRRLQKYRIQIKKCKCFFMCDSVEYLGLIVDADGIRATPEKVAAIEKAPQPHECCITVRSSWIIELLSKISAKPSNY